MLRKLLPVLFPGLLLALLGAYRVGFPPAQPAESRLYALPTTIHGLPGEDLSAEQAIIEDLDSDDILIRRYQRPDGIPVWVVLIYFVNTRSGGHDPQLCYRSQGYRTEGQPEVRVSLAEDPILAQSFVASRPGRSERVLTFWYTGEGGGMTGDVDRYRNRLFLQGLRRNRSYGVFVRVSTLENRVPGEAEAWNQRFVAEVARWLPSLIEE